MARLDDYGNLDYSEPTPVQDPTLIKPKVKTYDPLDPNQIQTNATGGTRQDNPNPSAPPAPTAPPGPQVPTTPTTTNAQPNSPYTAPNGYTKSYRDWILESLNSGVSPEETAKLFNTNWGATKGNEAVFQGTDAAHKYATIGLPQGYFTNEGGKELGPGLNEWGWTDRVEGPGSTSGGTGGVNPLTQNPVNNNLEALLTKLLGDEQTRNSGADAERAGLRDRMHGLLDKYSQDPTSNDPVIHAQADAYQANQQRALQQYRELAAERAHAEGIGSGAFDAQVGNATMQAGQKAGEFESGLINDEMKSRRQALSDILKQSGDSLSEQDRNELQNRIATMDASLRDMGLQADTSLRTQALGQDDTHFYDSLAHSYFQDQNGSDAAILRALGL